MLLFVTSYSNKAAIIGTQKLGHFYHCSNPPPPPPQLNLLTNTMASLDAENLGKRNHSYVRFRLKKGISSQFVEKTPGRTLSHVLNICFCIKQKY